MHIDRCDFYPDFLVYALSNFLKRAPDAAPVPVSKAHEGVLGCAEQVSGGCCFKAKGKGRKVCH